MISQAIKARTFFLLIALFALPSYAFSTIEAYYGDITEEGGPTVEAFVIYAPDSAIESVTINRVTVFSPMNQKRFFRLQIFNGLVKPFTWFCT